MNIDDNSLNQLKGMNTDSIKNLLNDKEKMGKLGIDPAKLQGMISDEQLNNVNQVLKNPDAIKKILQNQELINKFKQMFGK